MAGYWVKGVDGKPYFAEDTQTIIQWIQEHRIAPFTEIRKGESNEFKPAESYPEFYEAFGLPPNPFAVSATLNSKSVTPQSSIRVGLALKEGWRFFRNNLFLSYGALLFWFFIFILLAAIPTLFHAILVGILGPNAAIQYGAQLFSYMIQLIVAGPLMVGFYKFWLNMIDQENPNLVDFFNGFAIWWQAMLSQWIKTLIMVVIILLSLPFISLSLLSKFQDLLERGQLPVLEEWWGLVLALVFISLVIMMVMTLFWYVEFFLADRCSLKLSRCFGASARLALKNIGGIALLFTVISLLFLAGMLFFFIGALILAPWLILSAVHSYRQLVPRGTKLD